ncbi:MAG: hypothetical protein DRI30_05740, partial [Chloroflexi bacterium]
TSTFFRRIELMQGAWTKLLDFIRNPIMRNIILFAVVVFTAGLFWAAKISYKHPGPAIAVTMLMAALLIVGWAMNDRQAKLSQKADALQDNNRKLAQKTPTRKSNT